MQSGAVKPPTPKSTPPAPGQPDGAPAAPAPLKPSLPGPPYGLGFPPPPPAAAPAPPGAPNGLPPTSETYRSPYDAHPGIRAPAIGLPPGGKP